MPDDQFEKYPDEHPGWERLRRDVLPDDDTDDTDDEEGDAHGTSQ